MNQSQTLLSDRIAVVESCLLIGQTGAELEFLFTAFKNNKIPLILLGDSNRRAHARISIKNMYRI